MKKVILCILDGFGISNETNGNAIKQAKTVNIDNIINKYPDSLLDASGTNVGLPDGQMGNSEVGHINIGSGRVIYQSLELINKSILDNELQNNDNLNNVIDHVKNNNSRLHIFGLLSDGGVHSHINHILELINIAKNKGINEIFIHAITDGRDVFYKSALDYINILNESISKYENVLLASIHGRYYAMDRDKRYDRTKASYDVLLNTTDIVNVKDYINSSYENEIYDEFIVPKNTCSNGTIMDNDAVIWANFRPDRAIQIMSALFDEKFDGFECKKISNVESISFMKITINLDVDCMFDNDKIENTLGDVIENNNLKQLRIAETEKYAHVTYFFDGGVEKDFKNCDRILVASPKVATYDMKPEMSALEVTDKLVNSINENKYDLIIVNYANADMVGHTGNLKAATSAINCLDEQILKVYNTAIDNEYTLLITADHGNCENMLDENNNILTSHTTNKVPFVICDNSYNLVDGKLSDIAPTILEIMNITKPNDMTGNSLIKK